MKEYLRNIQELIKSVPAELADFNSPRDTTRIPTQASSNFITNKEQGDWAEKLLLHAINETSQNFVAVRYGKSDDLVAGEEGFDTFFQEFQAEINTIGKRPDLLIFHRKDFNHDLGTDISHIDEPAIHEYVKKAIAGIEVRSSAFLIDKYEQAMKEREEHYLRTALQKKQEILDEYIDLLSTPSRAHYIDILHSLNEKTMAAADFKVPGWRSNSRLIKLNDLLKELKSAIKEIQKRDYLSITPKVEDLKVVYKWIETFNVPHYYFQVFFDKIFGISFKDILKLISDSSREGTAFSVESDAKNQNKTTIKINSKEGTEIAARIDEPTHRSKRKEMNRGRLLFYVTFEGGTAYLNTKELCNTLGIDPNDF